MIRFGLNPFGVRVSVRFSAGFGSGSVRVGPRGSTWVRVGPRGSAWVRVGLRGSVSVFALVRDLGPGRPPWLVPRRSAWVGPRGPAWVHGWVRMGPHRSTWVRVGAGRGRSASMLHLCPHRVNGAGCAVGWRSCFLLRYSSICGTA